jgi:hypothetical protein
MNIKFPKVFLFLASAVSLLFFVSCAPVAVPATRTPIPTTTFTPAYSLTLTAAAVTAASVDETEAAMTAAMGETLSLTPSNTPPAGMTVVPVPGDLGWGAVHGKIVDGTTNLPIEGATIKCEQFSYTSPSLCNAVAITNADGIYSFVPVFFHDTDRITLFVEAPGYAPLHFEQSFFTQPDFHADLGLFPPTGDTPTSTPFLMCTPPACPNGVLVCGDPAGCPGGCGTICLLATPTE